MATTSIKWNSGDGSFTATYTGSGDGSVVVTSDRNEGIDREQAIKVQTTAGEPTREEFVAVRQLGLRERYITADGDVLCTSDGDVFGVLKE